MQTGFKPQTNLANGTGHVTALNFALHFDGLLGASDDAPNPRVSLYDFVPALNAVVEVDFVPIGAGPHAIATTIRLVSN